MGLELSYCELNRLEKFSDSATYMQLAILNGRGFGEVGVAYAKKSARLHTQVYPSLPLRKVANYGTGR